MSCRWHAYVPPVAYGMPTVCLRYALGTDGRRRVAREDDGNRQIPARLTVVAGRSILSSAVGAPATVGLTA